jgi:hypothetical protein
LGEEQLLKAPPSREHSKVEFGSEEEKPKVAELVLTVPEGPESMVASGEVVSGTCTVKVLEAGLASTLPVASFALTSKVCDPLERFV